jgi:chromosome segregation ATPase
MTLVRRSDLLRMKQRIRVVVRKLADTRYVGRLVRIAVAICKGPETREGARKLIEGHIRSEVERDPNSLLSSLLESLSVVNHRQVEMESFARMYRDEAKDRENMIQSLPVALRRLTRGQLEAQKELQRLDLELKKSSEEIVKRISNCEASLASLQLRIEKEVGSTRAQSTRAAREVVAPISSRDQPMAARAEELVDQLNQCARQLADLSGYLQVIANRTDFTRAENMGRSEIDDGFKPSVNRAR